MSWQTKRFGRLTILKEVAPAIFFCKCDCGNTIEAWWSLLDGRLVLNCGKCSDQHHRPNGHIRAYRTKSGKKKYRTSAEHNSWTGMNNRCFVKTNIAYDLYGGRGITVCERWRRGVGKRGESFQNFIADMGPRPQGMTLDRINPNGHYEPGNCRWATAKVQSENRGCVIWKHVEPPPVEAVLAMEARVQEEYDEMNPY